MELAVPPVEALSRINLIVLSLRDSRASLGNVVKVPSKASVGYSRHSKALRDGEYRANDGVQSP